MKNQKIEQLQACIDIANGVVIRLHDQARKRHAAHDYKYESELRDEATGAHKVVQALQDELSKLRGERFELSAVSYEVKN